MNLEKIRTRVIQWYYLLPMEAFIWLIGLGLLALYNPYGEDHFSICILSHLGFSYCPGCGLGRSVSLMLHGDIVSSFAAHPLGFIALILLSFRIGKLIIPFYKNFKTQKNNNNG